MNPIRTSRRNSRRGLATVEAALIFPLLLTITFAAIEYGWMFLKQEQIVDTARQAARIGAAWDSNRADVTDEIATEMQSAGMEDSGYTQRVPDPARTTRGRDYTVTISVPYHNIEITGVTLFPLPKTISATVSMQKEGP
jgi:Flp pilus assembly protein TadG